MAVPPSGMVTNGTNEAFGIARKMACQLSTSRGCIIAIANDSSHRLVDPRIYTFSGKVNSAPAVIFPNQTGYVQCVKSGYSLRGSVGVVTYDALGLNSFNRLQIMWHVPFDTLTFENLVNVRVGGEQASCDLFNRLYDPVAVDRTPSKNTPYTIATSEWNVSATMDNDTRATLAVVITTLK